jgi:glyoxylase-like metal-dependent hydrolase (beta-lactamase superfamily II)
MAIHILNCASMSPWWPRWHVGGVCLLVDTDQGPVLVDTGLGIHDHEAPFRMVKFFRLDFGIRYAPEETAVRQVAARGIRPEDIHHIVLTHLHFDHAGGLPDFPWAQVHLHRKEYEALQHPGKWIERFAYDPKDFIHLPRWELYECATEKWFDFDAIPLPFSPRMYLIPLFGHTSGLCGVAIQDGTGWLLQASDAIPISADFDITPDWANRLVLGHQYPRLKTFAKAHPEVRLLAGHAWKTSFPGGGKYAL